MIPLIQSFGDLFSGAAGDSTKWLSEEVKPSLSKHSKVLLQYLITKSSAISESLLHPNGFLKLTLTRLESGHALRMHIWLGQRQPKGNGWSNIHNHRWAFDTLILTGGYEQEVYCVSKTGMECYAYKYGLQRGRQTLLRQPRTLFVSLKHADIFKSGSLHSLKDKEFHRVRPQANLVTASLFVSGPPRPIKTSVLSPFCLSNTGNIPRPANRTTTLAYLHQLANALQ